MTAQGAGRPTRRLAAVARTARARLRHRARHAALAGLLLAGLGAWAGAIAGAPALASGEIGGSSTEAGTSPTGTGTSNCPSSNPPNQMTLVAGTPQTAILGSAFATGLQVALSNSDGCPVTSGAAGIPVTFSAPASGASGVFSTSGSNAVIVGADASGSVAAPAFIANGTAGGYTVTASSQYGSVSFSLTNTAAGVPARIVAIPLKRTSASVASRYPQPLQVKVLDANGNPIAGTTVTFTLGSGVSSACGTSSSSSAGASFTGGGAEATATTTASGVASSPLFTANGTAGSFTATAAVSGKEPSGGSGKENPAASSSDAATAVSFSLANLAGNPAKLATGVGSTQSTAAGTPFPIRLAATVTDAQKNPVPGALITFSAPLAGASGRFTVHARSSRHHRGRVSHPYTVKVKTNTCGIAVAPAFTANHQPGGYIVKATVKPARPAAFALVNEAP
jgi:protocatechuate 3,4-dioxygenase beta subunit